MSNVVAFRRRDDGLTIPPVPPRWRVVLNTGELRTVRALTRSSAISEAYRVVPELAGASGVRIARCVRVGEVP